MPDPRPGERLVQGAHHTGLDHGAGDVRTPDGLAPGQLAHPFPGDAGAQRAQAVHHGPRPVHPVLADPGQLTGQRGLVRIEQVAEQVQAPVLVPAGQLHARDERQPLGQRRTGSVPTGDGVVVGEREHVQPGRARPPHDLGGRPGPVGDVAVAVQIDPHAPFLSGTPAVNGHQERLPGARDARRPVRRPGQWSSRGLNAPYGRSGAMPGSRRSTSCGRSSMSTPASAGHRITHSQSAMASPA